MKVHRFRAAGLAVFTGLCVVMLAAMLPAAARADTPTYQFLRQYTTAGLGMPEGIAVDSAGNVYAADQDGGVNKFDLSGNYLLTIGSQGTAGAEGQFRTPWGVVVRGNELWVSDIDPRANCIQVFSLDGTFVQKITASWLADPTLWQPTGMAVDGAGHVWVAAYGSTKSVDELDSTGAYVSSFTCSSFVDPYWLALDEDGNVYVCDDAASAVSRWQGCVFKFTSTGASLATWDPLPALPGKTTNSCGGIAIDQASGLVYVADQYNGWVDVFTEDGALVTQFGTSGTDDGAAPGEFYMPWTVAVGPDGTVYVGDGQPSGHDGRVEAFTPASAPPDSTAPAIDCSLSGPTGVNGAETGWFIGPVTAHLTASDPDDAVDRIDWILSRGETELASGTTEGATLNLAVPTPGDGQYSLVSMATDSNGHSSEWNETGVQIDSAAPESQIFPPDLEHSSIWYDYTPLQMEFWSVFEPWPLAAYSWNLDLSGLDRVEYQIDPATPPAAAAWQQLPNIAPYWPEHGLFADVSGEGLHTVIARAVDVAGNVESPPVTVDVGIDLSAPNLTVTTPAEGAHYKLGPDPTAVWSASDPLSGVDWDASTPAEGTFDTSSLGAKTFEVTVYDWVGHVTTKTVKYVVENGPAITLPLPTTPLGATQPLAETFADAQAGNSDALMGDSTIRFSVPGAAESQVTAKFKAVTDTMPLPIVDSGWTLLAKQYDDVSQEFTTQVKCPTPGIYALWIHATVGGASSDTIRYYRVQYVSPGLQQPVNLDCTSIFNGNQTVPLKIKIVDGAGRPVTGLDVRLDVLGLHTGLQDDAGTSEVVPVGLQPTSSMRFVYDGNGVYHYNFSCKDLPSLIPGWATAKPGSMTVRFAVSARPAVAGAAGKTARAASSSTSRTGTDVSFIRVRW